VADDLAPRWASSALISIDVQRDLLDGQPFEIAGTSAAAERIATICKAFRQAGLPIVHVVRLYKRDGSNADLCRRRHIEEEGISLVIAGSEGAEIAPAIVPAGTGLDVELLLSGGVQEVGPGEVAIYKPRWGAFYETPLSAHLREHRVSTTVFCGCNFPNCPRTSIYEASERDFRVVVAEDAISGIYDRGREELRNIGVRLMGSGEIAASVGTPVAT
jgi:nicotinamidase-related amidase